MFVTELKKYIYENNKIEYVLSKLNCGHIKYHNSNQNYFSASFPDGDNPTSINVDNNEYLGYCSWTRNVNWNDGQDLIALIETIKQCDFKSAIKWLHDILDLDFNNKFCPPAKSKTDLKTQALSIFTNHLQCNQCTNVADIKIYDKSILDEYTPIEYIGLLHEGITPYTCQAFDIQYSYRRKRIIIPHKLWTTGQIIGINARTTIEGYEELGINKYSFTKGFNKSINLYGLWENYDMIKRKGYVVVFESEKSVLKRHSQLDGTGVALSGKIMSEEQRRILIGLNVDIIIALDNDVDINEIYNMCEKFYGIRNVYFVKDFENQIDKKDSPCDKGNEIYTNLLTNKIKYDIMLHNKYIKRIS